jgi:hypothetical protein
MSQLPPTISTADQVLEYIRCTQAALQKAAAVEDELQTIKQGLAQLGPQICDALIVNERVSADRRAEVESMVGDPVKLAKLLIKVAQHRNAQETRMGTPVGEKRGSAASAAGTGVRESEAQIFRDFGLPPPTATS